MGRPPRAMALEEPWFNLKINKNDNQPYKVFDINLVQKRSPHGSHVYHTIHLWVMYERTPEAMQK